MTTGPEGTPQVSVSGKIACILRQFTTGSPAKRLVDLSEGTSLPLTTTHRLLQHLVEDKVLRRDEDGLYKVGPLVHAIAHQLGSEAVAC